jgi:hypothetical protein
MHSIDIQELNKTLYIPSDLSECDARQYIEMSGLMYQYTVGALSYEDLRVHAVYKLLNLKRKPNPNQAVEEEKMSNILEISKLIDNFFNPTETQMIIKQHYINNPVKSFAPAWKRFYGPEDGFQNVKFGEYVTALRIFLEFSANPSYDLLLQLTATLYRPKKNFHFIRKRLPKYDGDCRVPFNAYFTDKYVKSFQYAPIGFVFGTYLFFGAMQQYITSAEIPWAGKIINLSILFDSASKSTEPEHAGLGMDAVLMSMAEGGSFGSMEKVEQTPFWTIMLKMYDIRIRNLEQQKQFEKYDKHN